MPMYRAELINRNLYYPKPRLHDKSLVLYLPFDKDDGSYARDRSGYNKHGVIYGASRVAGKVGGALSFDGVDDYAKVEPFTVYGWSEITIAEWLYAVKPKANTLWSKFSMIGDYWADYPSTYHLANNLTDYTALTAAWQTRRPDGTKHEYGYNWLSYVNQWTHVVRRFTADREFSVWINGAKVYSVIIPATEKTVLEWNPDTATNPAYYKRFVLGANVYFSENMTCMVDELRIYNRALTAEEIRRIMYMRGV
jgi:hypothetical protein